MGRQSGSSAADNGKRRLAGESTSTSGSGSKRGCLSQVSAAAAGSKGRARTAGAGDGCTLQQQQRPGWALAIAMDLAVLNNDGGGATGVMTSQQQLQLLQVPVVASLETLGTDLLSAVLAFLSAAEAEQLAGGCRALRTQSGYRSFVPFLRLRAPGGSEAHAAKAAARRRRRLLEEASAGDVDTPRACGVICKAEDEDEDEDEGGMASLAVAVGTPQRHASSLPIPIPPSPAGSFSFSSSSSTSCSSTPRRRNTSTRTSTNTKTPLPPYKTVLGALRTGAYPRLESLHLDLRRLTRKDVMALVDKLPPTLRELRLSHSLPPQTTTTTTSIEGGGGGHNKTASSSTTTTFLDPHDSGITTGGAIVVLPVGATLPLAHAPHHQEEEGEAAAWVEEQEVARATTATPTATVHMAGAYVRLAQSCGALRVLALPRQRFDLPTGTVPLLTSALASGCWPLLESLDVSLDLLALDAFAGPGLVGEGSPPGLQSLTLRLLFRPDQEDVDAEITGEGLALAFKEGRLRRLKSLALLPEEVRFGEGEGGVEVADMVWVATDALRPVFEAMVPSTITTDNDNNEPHPCPHLEALALGEFLSPPAFAALNRLLRSFSAAPTPPTHDRNNTNAARAPLKHLRLGRLNGDELAEQLLELAGLVRDGHLSALETLHINDLSSTERSRQGRVEPLRVIIEEGMKKRQSLPRLRNLSLRNAGATSADAEDIMLHAPCPLASLSLGNESEILIYNFNCVGWPAMRALRKAAASATTPAMAPPLLPALTTLNLHGNRLSPYGATQLVAALAKGAMPNLRTLDLRGTHLGPAGLMHLSKGLARLAAATTPPIGDSSNGPQQGMEPTVIPAATTSGMQPHQQQPPLSSPLPSLLASQPLVPASLSSSYTPTPTPTISPTTTKKRKRAKRGRLTMPRRPVRASTRAGAEAGPHTQQAARSVAAVAGGGDGGGRGRTLALRRLLLGVSGGGEEGGEIEEEGELQKRALMGLVQSPSLPHLTRLIIYDDENEALDAKTIAGLQAANPRVHVTVHSRLMAAPAL